MGDYTVTKEDLNDSKENNNAELIIKQENTSSLKENETSNKGVEKKKNGESFSKK